MKRRVSALTKHVAGTVDLASAGLGFALVGIVIATLAFGLAPSALALGLLALLVVD
ncbi:hypothetical protein ENSA5_64440 [Enhygromyxa salina]|uniref:Uncharacterized protein n=1 Tax=Enhygromyxa salina TaxID=215803 RepID=A0A2S9XCE3_9BACT|nr:hypothetical protein [Enhygromyxa salina]PRP90529.1 hypothetical protein ENSA5_64440 [Enhygromyxa salina]